MKRKQNDVKLKKLPCGNFPQKYVICAVKKDEYADAKQKIKLTWLKLRALLL